MVKAVREREFAAARNAEIDASIAAVNAARERDFALRRTSCESPDANLPPCEGEVAANFAAARNAEIDLSIAAVAIERERRFAQARNAEIAASIVAVKAARERDYAEARSAMALAWLHSIRDDRTQRFAAARNAEINASIAAVTAARERDFALSLTHCKTADFRDPARRSRAGRRGEFAGRPQRRGRCVPRRSAGRARSQLCASAQRRDHGLDRNGRDCPGPHRGPQHHALHRHGRALAAVRGRARPRARHEHDPLQAGRG